MQSQQSTKVQKVQKYNSTKTQKTQKIITKLVQNIQMYILMEGKGLYSNYVIKNWGGGRWGGGLVTPRG